MVKQKFIIKITQLKKDDPFEIDPNFLAWLRSFPPLPRRGKYNIAQIS